MKTGIRLMFVVIASLLICFSSSVWAANLTLNFSGDDDVKLYVSTDDASLGTFIGEANDWQQAFSFSFELTPGVNYYLHAVGTDSGFLAAFSGSFSIEGEDFTFINGTQQLVTNPTDWKVFTDNFGGTEAPVTDVGWYGDPPSPIKSPAQWIWTNAGHDTYTTRYFSSPIYADGLPPDQPRKLTVALSGNGSGKITSVPAGIYCGNDCTEYYQPTTTVVLTATAHPGGSVFAGWSGGGCSGTGTCTVTMDKVANVIATFTFPAQTASSVTMTAEGFIPWEIVSDYYNGGYGYDYFTGLPASGPGPNYGVVFDGVYIQKNADSYVDGKWRGEPTPNNIFWTQQPGAWMYVSGGFSGSLSLYYVNSGAPLKIYIYDGLKGGNLLATLVLPTIARDPDGTMPMGFATVSFSGVARSVDLGMGTWIDDITLGTPVIFHNTQPLANAGPDQTVYVGLDDLGKVTLDGSNSQANGNVIVSYNWTWTINGQVYTATGVNPVIELPVGQHDIQLVVNNGYESEPDHVNVEVKNTIANAGYDQIVCAGLDGLAKVTLDGSGSQANGDLTLSYKWTWTVDGQAHEANGINPVIELPVGQHDIQLVINDGLRDSEPDNVNVEVTPSYVTTIDFEDLENGDELGGYGYIYSSKGYSFTYTAASGEPDQHFTYFFKVGRSYIFNTGSAALQAYGGGSTTTLTRDDSQSFSLISIELAEMSEGATSVLFQGIKPDGQVVTQTFYLDGVRGWERFYFSSDFSKVTSVIWKQTENAGQPWYMFDNVAVAATPGSDLFYALKVTKSGDGSGTVTSAPEGINCGAVCTQSYQPNTYITLIATASAGSTFTGWSGPCSGTEVCTVAMTKATTVTATFDIELYALRIMKAGDGSGTVTSAPEGINCGAVCTQAYQPNTSISLTATANVGSIFTGWSGPCSGTGVCTVTMTKATRVTATFIQLLTLNVTKSGDGSGTVTSVPAGIGCGAVCSQTYQPNSSIILTATANVGSIFTGWSGPCSGTGVCTVTMTDATTVTATFTAVPVALAGTISVSPTSLSFGSVKKGGTASKIVTVKNGKLGSTLTVSISQSTITPASGTQSGEFSIGATTCDSPLLYRETCTITVNFNPASFGSNSTTNARSAVLGIASNDPKKPSATVKLTGSCPPPKISVSPSSIDFGSVTKGASWSGSITVKNTGTSDLEVGLPAITGDNATEFVIASTTCDEPLAKGKSCGITVNFNPSIDYGTKTATLTIPSNDPLRASSPRTVRLMGYSSPNSLSVFPYSLDFGEVRKGGTVSATVTVRNTGTAGLGVGTIPPIAGNNAGEFAVDENACTEPLSTGGTCTITVSFNPTSFGDDVKTAVLTIPTNDPTLASPLTVDLTGYAPPPIINASPSPLDFGSVVMGENPSMTINVTNEGVSDLEVGVPDISGMNRRLFSVDATTCTQPVAQGESCTITVSFDPLEAVHHGLYRKHYSNMGGLSWLFGKFWYNLLEKAAGPKAAVLTIPSNDPHMATFAVDLQGVAVPPPRISVTPVLLNFNLKATTPTDTKTVTVENEGIAALTISGIALTGDTSFAMDSTACDGATLLTGESCVINVTFTPTNEGWDKAELAISSNDPFRETATVYLSGNLSGKRKWK